MTASESCSSAAAGALGSTWDGGLGHVLNGVGGIVWVRTSCRVSGMSLCVPPRPGRVPAVFPALSRDKRFGSRRPAPCRSPSCSFAGDAPVQGCTFFKPCSSLLYKL